ncbi:hypothetical protein [Brevundimonas sp. DC300-4]|uniref:hypothetical protein n=1 Tax=Brevundimonas sp. DC300-4 TaxID=2804594 RepID=UPI003CF5AB22
MVEELICWLAKPGWEGWSAIGTLGAVIVALWSSNHGAREARQRDISAMVAVSSVANGVEDLLMGSRTRLGITGIAHEARLFSEFAPMQMASSTLANFDIARLSERAVMDQLLIVRSQIAMVEATAKRAHDGIVAEESYALILQTAIETVGAASEALRVACLRKRFPITGWYRERRGDANKG